MASNLLLGGFLALLLAAAFASAHGADPHSGVIVRVAEYNPETYEYTISCDIPEGVDTRRFYAIDPVPAGHEESYRTHNETFTWRLDPENYTELVHTKAMYHLYCEVQNFSAPPGEQNLAAEFHVDLREHRNGDTPDLYVLGSDGTTVTMKCDPPENVTDYTLSWKYRSREGEVSLPDLQNQRIVNITFPEPGAGWDVQCTVFDQSTGSSTAWDMPLELFDEGPAYVPTFEGCVPGESCPWVDPSGVPPNGSLIVHAAPTDVRIALHGAAQGLTGDDGTLHIGDIVPGLYNLVLAKDGYVERTELVSIRAGEETEVSYALAEQGGSEPPACYATAFSIPASCDGGVITHDGGTGCRTIVCESGAGRLQALACNKPGNFAPEYFEMYRQERQGSGLEICLLDWCIGDHSGFARSDAFPICEEGVPVCGNGILEPGEQCDDGNAADGDGCSAMCQEEASNPSCGNGILEQGEQCDDGNTASGDGCSNTCQDEPGDACYSSAASIPAECTGGTISQDSVSGVCRTLACAGLQVLACDKPDTGEKQYFEMYKQSDAAGVEICLADACISTNGYAKSADYPICTEGGGPDDPFCGNGIVESGEECDDANVVGGDGCSASCQAESSDPVCGNGVVEEGEACDDGNTADGDGCSSTCQEETAESSAELSIAPWYPQGLDVVYRCTAPFAPETVDWVFGDGSSWHGSARTDVYHVYPESGTYTAQCTAHAGAVSASDTIQVTLSS